jgi:flagellar protein FliO/FliZ
MDVSAYFRFLVALVFVLTLIVAMALLARRAGLGFPKAASKSSGNRRLSVVEVAPIDGRRRMVLVRRDNVEHLLLLGPTTETVIEAGIASGTDTVSPEDSLSASIGSKNGKNA